MKNANILGGGFAQTKNSKKLIKAEFDGGLMQFNADGWFNATVAAARFGKRVDHWLANQETQDYISALSELVHSSDMRDVDGSNTRNSGDLVNSNTSNVRDLGCDLFYSNTGESRILIKTRRGNSGGTWLHPDLAVVFARWLDVRFAVWCDRQIKALLRGELAPADLAPAQQYASLAFKHVCDVLTMTRTEQGKETHGYHYANEARLIGFAMSGSFADFDRATLMNQADLSLLQAVETHNSVLIGSGKSYEERKVLLPRFATERRAKLSNLSRLRHARSPCDQSRGES